MNATPHLLGGALVSAALGGHALAQQGLWPDVALVTTVGAVCGAAADWEFARSPAGRLVPLPAAHDGKRNGRTLGPGLYIWHSGPSHSIVAALGTAVLVAFMTWVRSDDSIWAYLLGYIAFWCYLSHLGLDLFRAWGQWILWPLGAGNERFERMRWPFPPISGRRFERVVSVLLGFGWGALLFSSWQAGVVVVIVLGVFWALLAFWRWQ